MSDDLIDRLAVDLRPVRSGAVARRLLIGLAIGAVVAAVGVLLWLGPRPDMVLAMATPMFWMKLGYTLAFGAVGVLAIERLARPSARLGARLMWLAVPVLLMATMAGLRLLLSAPAEAKSLIMGHSWRVCPWYIAILAIPLFLALTWAMRGLAPTRLRLTGALTGLTAGGSAAAIYCLHCPEATAPFVAIWYSLGMLIPAVVGALLGPRLLRW